MSLYCLKCTRKERKCKLCPGIVKIQVLGEVQCVYDPALPRKRKMQARIETIDTEAVYHSFVENVFQTDIF